MYDNDSKGISYSAGFFMLIAFAIAGMLFGSMLAIQVWQQMTGLPIDQMKAGMTNPAYGNAFKAMQVMNELVGYFLPAVVVAFLLHRRPMNLLGFSGGIKLTQVGLVILIIGVALMIGTALSYFNHELPIPADWRLRFDKMEAEYTQQTKAILDLKNTGDYLLALFVMGFIPSLCEETLFRGGLQNFLVRSSKNVWIPLIVVSLIFSAAHFSFYGFFFRFALGMVLGLIYQYSGKLWLAILGHFINNALAVTIYYIYLKQGKSVEESMNMTGSSWWSIFLLPVLMMLFVLFKRASDRRSTTY